MNVLLISPPYPKTFWSIDRAVELVGAKHDSPPLGLLTVAAMLPKDWNVELVDEAFQTISERQWARCDAVLIGGMVVQSTGILAAIREGRRRGKYVAVGGPWVYHWPELALQNGADLVMVGEVEEIMDQVVAAITTRVRGQILKPAVLPDITRSPLPRYDLVHLPHYATAMLQFTRGCPFQCEFCDVTLMQGRKPRIKTHEQVLGELDQLYRLGWRRYVMFVDDNFIGHLPAVRKLLPVVEAWMVKRRYPFMLVTQVSINVASDEKLLDAMYRAGFRRVFVGIETPDRDSLAAAKKKQNLTCDMDLACQRITKAGMQLMAGVILGFDGEQEGADERVFEFAERNAIPEVLVTMLGSGPGMEMERRLKKQNRLIETPMAKMSSQTGVPNFLPTRPLEQIVREYIRLYQRLYDTPTFLERTYRHFAAMETAEVPNVDRPPTFRELMAMGYLLVRKGLFDRHRGAFWSCLGRALRHFPTRVDRFLVSCLLHEHYLELVDMITADLEEQLAGMTESRRRDIYQPEAVLATLPVLENVA